MRTIFSLFVLLCGLSVTAISQNFDQCNGPLFHSTEAIRDNEAARFSWAMLVDEGTYSQEREGAGFGKASYSQAQTSAKTRLETENSESFKTKAYSYLKTYLSSQSESAYAKCLDSMTRSTVGVHTWVTRMGTSSVHVKIRWVPVETSSEEIHVQTRGSMDLPSIQKMWGVGFEEHEYSFERDPDHDLEIIVNLGRFSDGILVPVTPKVHEPETVPMLDDIIKKWNTVTPNDIVCSGDKIPPGIRVRVWVSGSWSEEPGVSGHYLVGPLGYPPPDGIWKTSLVIRDFNSQKVLSEQIYRHPNYFDASTDYEICVRLPEVADGHNIKITSGDPLTLHIQDSRAEYPH